VTGATNVTAFAPLRVPAYLRLWLGASIVFLAVMAQAVARSWLAFDLTGSNAAIGGVLLPFGLTLVVVTPVAGMVGDRLDKRTVLSAAIGLLAVTSAWIGLAVAWGAVDYWMLVVASAVQALAFAFYGPARMAFLTSLVPERQIPEAVALMMVNVEVSRVLGPAVAGVAIGAAWGLQGVFLGSAVLFVLGMLSALRLPGGMPHSRLVSSSPWGDIVDGVRYVRGRGDLSLLLACVLGVTALGLPHLALLPALSEDLFHRGPAGYGVLCAVSAGAAVVAGLLVGRLRERVGPWQLIVVSGAVFGGSLVALGLAPSYLAALVAVVPLGAGMLVFDTATQALVLRRSEQRLHARMQSLVTLGIAGYGVVALPVGILADVVGLRLTLAGMGSAVLVVVAVFWSRSSPWRDEVPEPALVVVPLLAEERAVLACNRTQPVGKEFG